MSLSHCVTSLVMFASMANLCFSDDFKEQENNLKVSFKSPEVALTSYTFPQTDDNLKL